MKPITSGDYTVRTGHCFLGIQAALGKGTPVTLALNECGQPTDEPGNYLAFVHSVAVPGGPADHSQFAVTFVLQDNDTSARWHTKGYLNTLPSEDGLHAGVFHVTLWTGIECDPDEFVEPGDYFLVTRLSEEEMRAEMARDGKVTFVLWPTDTIGENRQKDLQVNSIADFNGIITFTASTGLQDGTPLTLKGWISKTRDPVLQGYSGIVHVQKAA